MSFSKEYICLNILAALNLRYGDKELTLYMGFKFFSPGKDSTSHTSKYLEYLNAFLQEVCAREFFFLIKNFLCTCEHMCYSTLLMFTVIFLWDRIHLLHLVYWGLHNIVQNIVKVNKYKWDIDFAGKLTEFLPRDPPFSWVTEWKWERSILSVILW